MADEAVHKQKIQQAKNDLKRMLSQAEMFLASDNPDIGQVTDLFSRMEDARRSGFNHGYSLTFRHKEGPKNLSPAPERRHHE